MTDPADVLMDRDEFIREQRRAEKEDEYDRLSEAHHDLKEANRVRAHRIRILQRGLSRIADGSLDAEQAQALASESLRLESELH